MDAGYFPTTYFGHEYFAVGPQYFPEGTAVAPPAVSVFESTSRIGKYPIKKRKSTLFEDSEFIQMLTEYLEII